MHDPRGKLDRGLAKWFGSRKFTVTIIATVGLFSGALSGAEWTTIATMWIAGQTWIDRQKHQCDHELAIHKGGGE